MYLSPLAFHHTTTQLLTCVRVRVHVHVHVRVCVCVCVNVKGHRTKTKMQQCIFLLLEWKALQV